jgi:steroid delta-isomerase-like uncharacterized protein
VDIDLTEFARRYTAAWCSHDAAAVASFFAEDGSLTINDGVPSAGRNAIAAAAQDFITTFPDLIVAMDRVVPKEKTVEYHWTLTGRNTGPGGNGQFVRISGYEEWQMSPDGLIGKSLGHFDEADYAQQLTGSNR